MTCLCTLCNVLCLKCIAEICFPTKFSEKNTIVPRKTPHLLSEPQKQIRSFTLFDCLHFWHFPFFFLIKLVYHLTVHSFLFHFFQFSYDWGKHTEIEPQWAFFISTANAPCDSFLSVIWNAPSDSKEGVPGLKIWWKLGHYKFI